MPIKWTNCQFGCLCAIFKFWGYSYFHKHMTTLDKKRNSHLNTTVQGCCEPELMISNSSPAVPRSSPTYCRTRMWWTRAPNYTFQSRQFSRTLLELFCAEMMLSMALSSMRQGRSMMGLDLDLVLFNRKQQKLCNHSLLRHCTPETNRISFWETAHQHGNRLFVLRVRVQKSPGCDQAMYRRISIHHSYLLFSLCDIVGEVFGHYSLHHHPNPTVEHCEMVCICQKV